MYVSRLYAFTLGIFSTRLNIQTFANIFILADKCFKLCKYELSQRAVECENNKNLTN